MIRGLNSNTPSKLLLGVGAFYKDYIIGTDTPATATAKLLGATDGGGSFSATPAVRQVSVDGAPGPVKGLEVFDGWTAIMTANVKEVTLNNIKLALGAFDVASSGAVHGKHDIDDDDYATNITWAGTLSGSDTPVYIVLKNALSLNGLSLSVSDKNEAVIPLTLTGHYALTDLETPPFEIVYPAS